MLDSELHYRLLLPRLLPGLVLPLFFCVSSGIAQDAGSSKKPAENAAATSSKTRARQVAKPAVEKSSATVGAATQPQKERAETVATPAEAPDDPLSVLRDQIATAATTEERVRLQFKLVDQLVAANRKQEAVAQLDSMAGEERFDPVGFYNIGNAMARLGDDDRAVDAYRKAIGQRKGYYSRALNNLGVVLLRLGRWDESYEALLSALKLEKFHYAEASYNLGRLYTARGETEMAVREWRRALAVDPQHAGAAQALGNPESASNPSVAAGRPAFGTGAAKQPAASASPSANGTLQVDPTTYELLQRARSARERGRNDDAVRDYRSVLSRMGGYFAPANLELAFALITLKHNDEAIALLLLVSTNDGARFPISYYHLARLYEVKGDLKAAVENYERAATAYGDDSQFLLDISRVREKLGDLSGALTALEQYVRASERAGRKSEWFDGRLAELRQKIAAASQNSKP
jgi:tetratricopeptide (TPR) repeat protein